MLYFSIISIILQNIQEILEPEGNGDLSEIHRKSKDWEMLFQIIDRKHALNHPIKFQLEWKALSWK